MQPFDQRLSRPWIHEQGLEISLSTCTEPWTNVRRSIARKGASLLPCEPHEGLRMSNEQTVATDLGRTYHGL